MKALHENQLVMLQGGDVYEPGSWQCGAATAFLTGLGGLAGTLVGGPLGGVLGATIMNGVATAGPC